MINIVVKKPSECSIYELDQFETLVKKGGEVTVDGLCDRIKNAEKLVFLFEDAVILAGIAALKHPNMHYKQSVFTKAGSKENPQEFTFEAGWIFVEEQFRGRRYSQDLLKTVTKLADDKCLFATTRENNKRMRRTNSRCGFQQTGHPYRSETGNYNLILYTKRPINTID